MDTTLGEIISIVGLDFVKYRFYRNGWFINHIEGCMVAGVTDQLTGVTVYGFSSWQETDTYIWHLNRDHALYLMEVNLFVN